MMSGLPTPHRGMIDPQTLSQFPLWEAKHPPPSDKALRKGASGWQRVITQELDDGRNEVNFRGGFNAFPVGNRMRANAKLVDNPPLDELDV